MIEPKTYNCRDMHKYYKSCGGKLDYKTFKLIISENNKRNAALVIKGYYYALPSPLGWLRVIKNRRHIGINENGNIVGAVNWGESKKLKQAIIDRGEIPLENDNGGVKWLVYYTDNFYFCWNWFCSVLLHNYNKFKFMPSRTNARDLIASITLDSEFLYKEIKENADSGKRNILERVITKDRDYVRSEQ